MSRFSIRTQIFAFAGAFLILLAASASFSVLTNSRLGSLVVATDAVKSQETLISRITAEVDSALVQVLMIDRGEPTAYDKLAQHLGNAEAHVANAEAIIASPATASAAKPELYDNLMAIAAELSALHVSVPDMQSAPSHERSRDFRNRVIPLLQGHVDTLRLQKDILSAEVDGETQAVLEVAKGSTPLMLAGLVGGLGIGLVLAFLFGRKLSDPVQRAAEAVSSIAENDFSCEISGIERRDEIGDIARKLKALQEKLAEAEIADKRIRAEREMRIDLFQTLSMAMSRLKGGALQERITGSDWSELGDSYVSLCDDFNDLAATLETLVGSLRGSSSMVAENSRELSTMSDDMSQRAVMQAATIEQSAAALEELSESVRSAAERAKDVENKAVEGRRRAEDGQLVMGQALEAMSSIAKSSEQINQIIGVIDDIAFQTNLLALNAGVEAARAGDAGKGFSVVASEVRGLAQRASESAREIKNLVTNSTAQVEDGERLVQKTSETLGQIAESVNDVSVMVADISTSASEQASGVSEINVGVSELDKVTQQNTAMVADVSSSSQELSGEAARLTELLARFSGDVVAAAPVQTAQKTVTKVDAPTPPIQPTADKLGGWDAELKEPDPVPMAQPQLKVANGGDAGIWKDF